MPSNWLHIDTGFPVFSGEESSEEKLTSIQNYMFMLVEQLRYTLYNLDLTNMNKTAISHFTKTITDPIYADLKDVEGNVTQLGVTAEGLAARVSNAEGAYAALSMTVDGMSATVQDVAKGMGQTLRLGADGVTITNASGSRLTIDGGQINAENLNLSGKITFSDLTSSARDTINGAVTKANDAYALASKVQVPDYIKSTYIDSATVRSPTIEGGTVSGAELFFGAGGSVGKLFANYGFDGEGYTELVQLGSNAGIAIIATTNIRIGGNSVWLDVEADNIRVKKNGVWVRLTAI